MPTLDSNTLTRFVADIFQRGAVPQRVAQQVAESLVLSNLKGHDSHGVIRVIEYVDWVQRGWINPLARLTVVKEQSCILILDGEFGFGQVVGHEAIRLGILKAKSEGACILSLKCSGHLGRLGEFKPPTPASSASPSPTPTEAASSSPRTAAATVASPPTRSPAASP
jgi:hydroxycarboxylate dehydrogenase B